MPAPSPGLTAAALLDLLDERLFFVAPLFGCVAPLPYMDEHAPREATVMRRASVLIMVVWGEAASTPAVWRQPELHLYYDAPACVDT